MGRALLLHHDLDNKRITENTHKLFYRLTYFQQDGLHPTADKLAAIRDAPKPTNVEELHSFIGLITFYRKFIPCQATIMAPLYTLLQSNIKWVWVDEQEHAFEDGKRALLESSMLVHFDNKLPVVLSCNASPTGVSCVLRT